MIVTLHNRAAVDLAIEAIDSLVWVDDRKEHSDTYFAHIAANLTAIDEASHDY